MLKLAVFFVILIGSVFLGHLIANDSGNVLIEFSGWTVNTSFWFLLITVATLYLILHLAGKTISGAYKTSDRISKFLSSRKKIKSQKLTRQGLIKLNEGKWRLAENDLVKASPYSETPLINYLAAARAAQEQGADKRRDEYLRLAQESTPGASIAIELTQAELQINHGQLEQALASLQHLRSLAPRHPHVLKLLQHLYVQVGDWSQLREMLPVIKKEQVIKSSDFKALELKTYLGLLKSAVNQEANNLEKLFNDFPKHIRNEPTIVFEYVNYQIIHNENASGDRLIESVLKKAWHDDLISLYGKVKSLDPKRQLNFAEKCLADHPNNPHLFSALGRICMRNKLWGKARTYFEESLNVTPSVQIYAELGQLLEEIGQTEEAVHCYRQGLLFFASPKKESAAA